MNDYGKLEIIYKEIDRLIEMNATTATQEFQDWKLKAARFLSHYFGMQSIEMEQFRKTQFHPIFDYDDESKCIECCKKGLEATKRVFETYLDDISTDMLDKAEKSMQQKLKEMRQWQHEDMLLANISQRTSMAKTKEYKKVFIVHGHDNALKQEVARMVEKQGLEAIILSEQANRGKTIIEKFEEHSDVGAAICLFTGDDYGKAKDATSENLRARQNVVFEAGYFMGKLGRGNVILIASPDIEIPSDLQGVVYTNKDMWQTDVLRELKAIGYNVDFNKLFA
ncbi:nucleotide-binding protein [Faecalibacterium sp. I3-3-33]|uniref:TIR domain-containing protein n=1 Tax=Faecalibacterium sp. I3-3-33 TaxID=2929492 RepID=UPI002014D2FC|nr:nucleotide-binding protein [Faecalibacterium sp. I3-3-33]UQK45859.1 nucleotide-binding protein [Faecalibacterium sp. I3-3-33]